MPVKIRIATPEDFAVLYPLLADSDVFHAEALPHIFKGSDEQTRMDQLAKFMSKTESAWFIAADGKAIVGALLIQLINAPDMPLFVPRRFAHIADLVVHPKYRKQHIGRKLMEQAQDWAVGKGAMQMELAVWEFNRGAIKFYEKLGYTTLRRVMTMDIAPKK